MQDNDSLQRFLLEHANIRGEIAHLNTTYKTIIAQHHYPAAVRQLLGEAMVACVLLTGSIKFAGEVSLQFQGDTRLPLLLVQCDNNLNIRAFAKYQEDDGAIDYQNAFLQGQMALSINQYKQTNVYQSVVPIRSTSMAENLTYYFAQSEQISSRVWLAVNDNQAAGMLLQLLPDQQTTQREQFWEYAVMLGETIHEQELLSLDNATLLYRLYNETECRLFDSRTVKFKCRCNQDKMQQVLQVLGEEDIRQLLDETGQIKITCDFCNHQYAFDAIDVAVLFNKKSPL